MIPAIILTGDISTESLRDIAGHGCVLLNKPVRAMDLTRLVEILLAKPAATAPGSVEQLPLRLGTGMRQSSTVFVVDDDQAVGEAIADLLQENGYSVRLFTDGAAFLDAYRPGSHGCLLVDALMPGMSGIALIERIII